MPLDDDDKKAIEEMIGAAFTGESFTKSIGKVIEAQVGKAIKAIDVSKTIGETVPKLIDEKLEALKTELKPKEPDPPAGGAGGAGNGGAGTKPVTDDPEFKKLQVKLAEMEAANKAAAKRAEEAEERRKAELLNNSIRDALIAGGADPKRVPLALPSLKERGIVKLNDEGKPVFLLKREWGDELVAAEDGAKEWLGTEEGKFFVPPKNTQGTGDRIEKPNVATRDKSGAVDWGNLAGRINLGVLEHVSE